MKDTLDPVSQLQWDNRRDALVAIFKAWTSDEPAGVHHTLQRLCADSDLAQAAYWLLQALPSDVAVAVAQHSILGTGYVASFHEEVESAAEWWADNATQLERRVYAREAIKRLHPKDKAKLKKWVASDDF